MTRSILWKPTSVGVAALALMVAAGPAKAALVSFTGYGSIPAGEKLITDFSSDTGLSGSYLLETRTTGDYAAPAISGIARDPNQYLAIEGGDNATLSVALGGPYHDVSVYIGSLDPYNTISFSNGRSFTGGELASLTGALDDGDQQGMLSNGMFTFEFAAAVTGVTFASSQNALEVASVSAGVPEVSTWSMMLLGFVGLGFAGYRRHRSSNVA